MNVTPVISKIDETSLRWTSPTFASFVTRTVEIHKNGSLFRTDTVQSSGSVNISGLDAGLYKIRYTVSSNSEPLSDFSNEVSLVPEVSAIPTITGFEAQIKADGFAIVNITGVTGAVVHYQDVNNVDFVVGTIINLDGTIQVGISNAGVYTFTQIENSKSVSVKTATTTITANVSTTCINISDLKIIGTGTEVANSKRIYRTSFQGTPPTSIAWSRSGQGIVIVSGGNAQDAEIQIGNSGGTLSVSFTGCNGVVTTKDYNFAIGTVLPNCDNGLTSFFLGAVVYDKTANTINYQFNADNLATATWNIKQGATVIQSGQVSHNSNNKTVSGINTLPAGSYTFELVGLSCTGTATKPFTVAADTGGGLASCNNGELAFSIISVIHNATNNTLTYQFSASGLSLAKWSIKQGILILATGTVSHTANVVTIAVPSLTTGAYVFELVGNSCNGIATKSFNAISSGGTGGGAVTKKVVALAKFADTGTCSTNLIQFGYSGSSNITPTNFTDSTGTKRVTNINGVITEVQSGGSVYQSKEYDLLAGTYHFFSRQKGLITNIFYDGVITI